LNTNIRGDRSLVNLAFTEPAYFGSDISFGFDLFGNEQDNSDTSSFTVSEIGLGFRIGLPLSDDLVLKTRAKYTRNEVYGVASNASAALKQLEGKRNISELGYTLAYSSLDNPMIPSSGVLLNLSQDFYGGDVSNLGTVFSGKYYHDFDKDLIGSLHMNAGHIFAFNSEDLPISDSFMEPGTLLKGFASRGISPRLHPDLTNSKQEAIGGDTYFSGTAEVNFPIPVISDDYGIRGGLHLNAGTLFGSDLVTDPVVNDSSMLRSSIGASIFWDSPIGMLRFDFTEVLNKETKSQYEWNVFRSFFISMTAQL